ncbi:Ankyrin repeat domain-containing protein [Sulfidibacter corallicola]
MAIGDSFWMRLYRISTYLLISFSVLVLVTSSYSLTFVTSIGLALVLLASLIPPEQRVVITTAGLELTSWRYATSLAWAECVEAEVRSGWTLHLQTGRWVRLERRAFSWHNWRKLNAEVRRQLGRHQVPIKGNPKRDARHQLWIGLGIVAGLALGSLFFVGKHALLNHSAKFGTQDRVRFWLALGADPNHPVGQARKTTALGEAIFHEHLNVARILLEAGADVKRPAYRSETPMELACRLEYADMVLLLEEFGSEGSCTELSRVDSDSDVSP